MLIVNPPHLQTPEAMEAKAAECEADALRAERDGDLHLAKGYQRRAAHLRERAAIVREQRPRGYGGVRFG